MQRAQPEPKDAFRYFRRIATQWRDNDVYGHVNNAVHYTWFDTIVNGWLIERGVLAIGRSPSVGLVVSNGCQYFGPVAFPDEVTAALRAARIGNGSVSYEIGLFRNDDPLSFALGSFTHAYVRADDHRPVALPAELRVALAELAP